MNKDLPNWFTENEDFFHGMGDIPYGQILNGITFLDNTPWCEFEGPFYLVKSFEANGWFVEMELAEVPMKDMHISFGLMEMYKNALFEIYHREGFEFDDINLMHHEEYAHVLLEYMQDVFPFWQLGRSFVKSQNLESTHKLTATALTLEDVSDAILGAITKDYEPRLAVQMGDIIDPHDLKLCYMQETIEITRL